MSVEPKAGTDEDVTLDTGFPAHDDDFLTYPIHKLVSVFENPDEAVAAVAELQANGFKMEDIEAFCGWENKNERRVAGARPGIWDAFLHAARHVGPSRIYIERYERHLQAGHCIILVKVTKKERKHRAAEILHKHTKERVTYFGLLAADEIK